MSVGEFALLGLIALAVVVIVRFELYCLRDAARRSDHELRYLTRTGWLVVIALVIPLGGVCYLFYGRNGD
ncbi:MAG TPA: PLDc N-terminal domain-containing protein [Jatrophihabitans sp.]|nr:PLDc N-terminal domain-containing protein [Jatrophihabitans sp.]